MYSLGMSGERLTMRIRRKMFRAMLSQEMGWYDDKVNGVGAICARLSGEAASVQGVSAVDRKTVCQILKRSFL